MTIAPAACFGGAAVLLGVPLKNSGGLRNAVSSGSELSVLAPVGVDVGAGHVVVEHRVPEPVDGVGELGLERPG